MRSISKSFPGVRALSDVSLDVRRGEIHALLGENGAGKSTLMKILSGDYQMDSGEILLDGRAAAIHSPRHGVELGISVMYQELNVVPTLTVTENILLGKLPPGPLPGTVDWRAAHRLASEKLEWLSVDLAPRTLVGDLNIAQKQVVEITRALSRDARIVVMDEPTAALTDREVQSLFCIMRTLRERGVAIIYISHRLDELFEIADRVTILRDGRKVDTVNLAETTRGQLVTLMVGRELKDLYPKRASVVGQELLRVEGLTQGKKLRDISFTVHKGEILGIFGLMGAGRTHLARVLFGDVPKDRGQILLDGREVHAVSPQQARLAGLGLVPLDRKGEGLILDQDIRRNITLANVPAYARGGFLRQDAEKQSAERWMQALGICARGQDQKVLNLSGGNQQKVVLAKWLETQARVLILNEPTRGVDVGAKAEIYRLLEDLCEQGKGIIMMSSELPEILALADRIVVMCQGVITGVFSRSEATQERLLRAAIGCADETTFACPAEGA
jgi:ribose transport system ATP-binding protein